MKKWLPFLITLSALSGCSLLTSPDSLDKNRGVDGSVDIADGGPDLSQPDVTSACALCSDPAPYCDELEGLCVACLDNSHCPGDEECRNGACSECLDSTECITPEAPVCAGAGPSAGRCVPCAGGMGCEGILSAAGVDLLVCHEPAGEPNVCVECDGEDQCGMFVCDIQASECSTRRVGGGVVCGGCVSTEQCGADQVCAQEIFAGEATGFYCLPRAEVACVNRVRERDFWMSVEGETVEVCHPKGTTCTGLLNRGTVCAEPADCGLSDVDDSTCIDDLCVYLCDGAQDCDSGELCGIDDVCMPAPSG